MRTLFRHPKTVYVIVKHTERVFKEVLLVLRLSRLVSKSVSCILLSLFLCFASAMCWLQADAAPVPKATQIPAATNVQPFDIDDNGFYLLPERLLEENPNKGQAPRYLLKTDVPNRQLIIEFPFAKLKTGFPKGYAVGLQQIEKVELLEHHGSLIDMARVLITFKNGTDLSKKSLTALKDGRLLLPAPPLSVSTSESRHGGGIIQGTQTPNYAKNTLSNGSEKPNNTERTPIETIEVEDEFFLLKPPAGSPPLQVKNQFYLENPNRFVLDLEPAQISSKLFNAPPDANGRYPSSGVTQWLGWSVRLSQNTPTVVRVVIETEEPINFSVLRGEHNTFQNSIIIQPAIEKNPFWDKLKPHKKKPFGSLKQLYISKETPNIPIKFRLESQYPIQYRLKKETETRFSVDLPSIQAPNEPLGFDVSAFPSIKSLSHVQTAQGSRLIVELNKPYNDIRTTPFTSAKALEISFQVMKPMVSPPVNSPKGKPIVVVDAGHGGKDAGAIRAGVQEKDLNLKVALFLRDELKAKGYIVYMTRDTDRFLSLKEITEVAASFRPTVFVSVHHNSSTNSSIYGLETYYYHGFSLDLAKAIHERQVASIPVVDRGVRRNQFYVINHTQVPSVLCELGYVSNDKERSILVTTARQKQHAKAIAEGIDAFLKRYKAP